MSIDVLDPLGYFSRSTSNVSSFSDNIPLLFELSNSFKALFTFRFSINLMKRVAFLYGLWFFALPLNNPFCDHFVFDK